MAGLIGFPSATVGDSAVIHTAALTPIGTRAFDAAGNEYIYLKGVTNCAAGKWVSFNATTFTAVLLAADAVGRVAVAMAAVDGSSYGWFQIYGFYASASSDTVAAAGGLFIDGTAGRVDDASVAGDMVYGAVSTAADTANVLPVNLSYPYVTNTVPA